MKSKSVFNASFWSCSAQSLEAYLTVLFQIKMRIIFTVFFPRHYQLEDVQLVNVLYFPKHAMTRPAHHEQLRGKREAAPPLMQDWTAPGSGVPRFLTDAGQRNSFPGVQPSIPQPRFPPSPGLPRAPTLALTQVVGPRNHHHREESRSGFATCLSEGKAHFQAPVLVFDNTH